MSKCSCLTSKMPSLKRYFFKLYWGFVKINSKINKMTQMVSLLYINKSTITALAMIILHKSLVKKAC